MAWPGRQHLPGYQQAGYQYPTVAQHQVYTSSSPQGHQQFVASSGGPNVFGPQRQHCQYDASNTLTPRILSLRFIPGTPDKHAVAVTLFGLIVMIVLLGLSFQLTGLPWAVITVIILIISTRRAGREYLDGCAIPPPPHFPPLFGAVEPDNFQFGFWFLIAVVAFVSLAMQYRRRGTVAAPPSVTPPRKRGCFNDDCYMPRGARALVEGPEGYGVDPSTVAAWNEEDEVAEDEEEEDEAHDIA